MKKMCVECNKSYEGKGNTKFCSPQCKEKYNNSKTKEKMENAIEVLKTPVNTTIYPAATKKFGGKAWLRLYRINKDLVNRGRIKLIVKLDTKGGVEVIESLSNNSVGRGNLFPEVAPPVKEEVWSAVVFTDSIITEYMSDEGSIPMSMFFQYYDEIPNSLKIAQMVPREAIPHFDTRIGHGSSRTEQVNDVKNWINQEKSDSKLRQIEEDGQ